MPEFAHAALRRALADITSRRTFLGAPLLGAAGLVAVIHDADAKKKKEGSTKSPKKKSAKRASAS